MKSAKVMFGELGYSKYENSKEIVYIYATKEKHIQITFTNKIYFGYFIDYNDGGLYILKFDMPTFKAIHKQLEELGWLE